ncbi:hypothetical protein [Geomobilimonas luticola]|uniref:Uncharacterized protein n=1 Tax=Geomobilimonas luticola TaxID=1114878 RepID=A0ABS5SEN2_9BACT|nr:hypothetical protein [Geomobilimonas luticola]MBT0653820.1 hypothetical protein [Geomobilimonas luticola]
MSRKSLKYSALLFATLLATALTGCGTGNKEGGTVADVAKVDEAKCRVCHADTIDPVSGTSILQDYLGTKDSTGAVITPASVHFQLPDGTPNADAGCQGCHGGGAQHNGVGPIPFNNPLAEGRCNAAECHNNKVPTGLTGTAFAATCGGCHNAAIHGIQFKDPALFNDCIGCHAIAQTHPTNVVKDNNSGVRAVTAEFSKWSHHVTGVNLQNAHCAACHLEGKAEGGKIVVDRAYHMADNKTHLRHADTDADMQWDPAAPNHTTMDNFCMSCHDANGATSAQSAVIRALMIPAAGKTASASNPFGDTISNRYDKMLRPAVVNVDSQFNTTNNSHHGVKGPRYSGRTRDAGPRQIKNPAAFAANSSSTLWGKRSTIYDSVNAITGVKETVNAAFNALYVPLENAGGEASPRTGAQTLGDDSTLHCGDCHTVGQWKPGTAKSFNPTGPTSEVAGFVSPAIGAHGSNNEYMLRNSRGTDERHTQDAYVASAGVITLQNPNAAFLVCFNCHSYKRYGSVYNATGTTGPHAGEYDASGRCNGVGNTIPFNGYTTGTATDGTQFLSRIGEFTRAEGSSTPAFAPGFPLNFANAPGGVQAATYTGEQNADFGNVFGIQCLNCHNSGLGNGYGGIHGSANNSPGTANTAAAGGYLNPDPSVKGGAYVDGMGNTGKVQRFLPGLGNVMHVPGTLGGVTGGKVAGPITNSTSVYTFVTGGISNDTNWEQVAWQQVAGQPVTVTARAGAGCYTLNDEGTGSSLDDPASAAYGIKGQSFDGNPASTPNAAKTWGGCDDHTGTVVGGGDHGFIKRINRPVTY